MYDGEEGKRADYAASLPPFLLREVLLPHLQRGGRAVVLAEEWHTVDAVLHLDWLLRNAQVREARASAAAACRGGTFAFWETATGLKGASTPMNVD